MAKRKYLLTTKYLGDYIDIKKVQENIKSYHYLNRDHPLILKLLEDQYVVLTKFGAVSFWNVKKRLESQFINEIIPYVRNYREGYPFFDTLKVYIGYQKEESMSFEQVFLEELDLEKMKIISYISAQSVALDRYEEEINLVLKEARQVIDNLRVSGKTKYSEKLMLQRIGQVLAVKQNTIVNVALFDKLDETWERPELENLYNRLFVEYELQERFDVLNKKMDFLSESNATLVNFISSQKNNTMEFIIVILIIVELIFPILEWFKIFPR
jgi:uncharacterized Rmd1/YagE family protein